MYVMGTYIPPYFAALVAVAMATAPLVAWLAYRTAQRRQFRGLIAMSIRASRRRARKQQAKAAAKRVEQEAKEWAAIHAAAPRSPWHPVLSEFIPLVIEDHRSTVVESFADLAKHNLLQPIRYMNKGAEARRQQWNRLSGRTTKLDLTWVGVGTGLGVVTGAVLGLPVPPELFPFVPMPVVLALILAPVGGYAGHMFKASGSYYDGMILVIVNERRSFTRPEKVTAQARAWVPKSLVAWRSEDWRYTDANGQPYLWVLIPDCQRVKDVLNGTRDYLQLPTDRYRAKDAAVYAQRSWNRMASDAALNCADADDGEFESDSRIKELMPYIIPGVIAACGPLLVMFTA